MSNIGNFIWFIYKNIITYRWGVHPKSSFYRWVTQADLKPTKVEEVRLRMGNG